MLMMLPFEAPTIFEGIHKSYFKMPRVVKDQRSRFENDDLFRQLSHESAVKYTGFKDRPLEERQMKFIANCQEGHTEVSVVQSGSQFTLMFNPTIDPACNNEGCNFDRALGKVHIKAGFILNGVCVLWRGWIDLQRLEGFGCLEFDEYRAYIEDAMTKQSIQDKQQSCNQGALGRLANGQPALPPAQHSFSPATAAAAVAAITTNSMLPPLGLNPGCLGGPFGLDPNLVPGPPGAGAQPPPPPPPPQGPPVSLAESAAAHYGNAAIAAAAAAAFHQALSIGGGGPGGLAGPPPPPTSVAAELAALTNGSHHPVLQLPYTNGAPPPPSSQHLIPHAGGGSPLAHLHTSPQHQFLNPNNSNQQQGCNGISSAQSMQHTNHQRSPERENRQTQAADLNAGANATPNQANRRSHQAVKRAPEETSDEVDVVSDISVHELDFPPRRIFKSEPITHHHNHHHHHPAHNHHHHQQKLARRAA